jgi:tRNA threonylcarbamoyladenosine modification (KEOPS) complex  Pcc1 subunit
VTERPAFYALRGGGWRDYVSLLHPPYTLWHLSYVALGWAAAPTAHTDRLWWALAAFFLAVGIGAHALDELNGRPLNTRIPTPILVMLALGSIALAGLIGIAAAERTSWWLLAFVALGCFIVCAYNLEWFGSRFHTDAWFALAWGAFPALTASYANALSIRAEGILVAAACFALSAAQRTLSTPVRDLRRRISRVEGSLERTDGTIEPIDASTLRAPAETALRWLSLAMPLLAAGAVVARLA